MKSIPAILVMIVVVVVVVVVTLSCKGRIKEANAAGLNIDLNEPPPLEDDLDEEDEDDLIVASQNNSHNNGSTNEDKKKKTRTRTKTKEDGSQSSSCIRPSKLKQVHPMSLKDRIQFATLMGTRASIDKLPDYCDYDKFNRESALYNKNKYMKGGGGRRKSIHSEYNNHMDVNESIFRQSMFLKRCLDVFRSRINYRLGKKTYLEGITPLADRSPNEIRRLFMTSPPIEFSKFKTESEYRTEVLKERESIQEDDLELGSQSSAAGGQAIKIDPRKIKSFSKDHTITMDIETAKATIEAMLWPKDADDDKQVDDDDDYKEALREELMGTDMESMSQACAGDNQDNSSSSAMSPYPDDHWPLTRDKGASEKAARSYLWLTNSGAKYQAPELSKFERKSLDWSKHQCFFRIYKERLNCGSCYVMASTALAEFVKCSEQIGSIELRKFSKNYVLDCGLRYSSVNLGCSGGSIFETLRFIGHSGVYTVNQWKEKHRSIDKSNLHSSIERKCPIDPFTPKQTWGQIKILLNPVKVHPNDWLEALQDGPLVASVQMPSEGMETYKGGVHDGAGCKGSHYWHAMLLVGYGIDEHGIAYWRFRNSFGPNWGDEGHFNLAMSVPDECLAGGVRVFRESIDLRDLDDVGQHAGH